MKPIHSLTARSLQTFTLLLTLWVPLAQAEAVVAGYVTRLRGEVLLLADAKTQPLALGSTLPLGGRLSTGADARLEARMQDGSLLTLGERTEFVLEQVAGSTAAVRDSRFSLLKGAFRAITGTLADGQKPASWQVRTPVAIIGVRGTDVWGGLDLLGAGAATLDVVMFEGKGVYVQNSLGTTDLRAGGEGTTVRGSALVPVPPIVGTTDLLASGKATLGLGGSEAPISPVLWGEPKRQAAQRSVSW